MLLCQLETRRHQTRMQDKRRSAARLRRRSFPQLERVEDRTLLAVAVWDGVGELRDINNNIIRQADGTSWEDNLNWVGNVLPANGDNVVIPDVAATTIVRLGGDAWPTRDWHISSLTSDEAFAFSGGTLTVDSTVQVNNTFTMNGGGARECNGPARQRRPRLERLRHLPSRFDQRRSG
jgi:hypothetical protein